MQYNYYKFITQSIPYIRIFGYLPRFYPATGTTDLHFFGGLHHMVEPTTARAIIFTIIYTKETHFGYANGACKSYMAQIRLIWHLGIALKS